MKPLFFVGLHCVAHTNEFSRCMISVNRLEGRRKPLDINDWILDSGAFSRLDSGQGHMAVADYAAQIRRWSQCGRLLAAVAQDYMCEPSILAKTGLTVAEHQRLTVANYDALLEQDVGAYVLPVLQGYRPAEYVSHLAQYGDRLKLGQWVGVGSVCRRNGRPELIAAILWPIKERRPDLRLHFFGIKYTTLAWPAVRALTYSCDSMAWSYAARREGRNANDWREAAAYCQRIEQLPEQGGML